MTVKHDSAEPEAPRWVTAQALRAALPIAAAADALEQALRAVRPPSSPPRAVASAEDDGQLITMPSSSAVGSGAKLVTVKQDNPARGMPSVQAIYVLFEPTSLSPIALFEGAELTRLRTSAVSALATRYLARSDAERLVVFGAGVQATAHVEAMRAVRPISEVTIVGSGGESAARLVALLVANGVQARLGERTSVRDADLICTCTTATEPLFNGDWLTAGTHVNAIGSYRPDTREVDTQAIVRSQVILEDRQAVLEEAGDLRIPIAEGAISPADAFADLAAVINGTFRPTSPQSITVFKSVGVAWEDLVVAAEAAHVLGLLAEPSTKRLDSWRRRPEP